MTDAPVRKVAIFISGGGSNMVCLVNAMRLLSAEPCLVLSNNPEAAGLKKAQKLGVKTQVIDHRPYRDDRVAYDDALHEALLDCGADILCLAGFMRVLGAEFTQKWSGRCLNIHPSLLPKYQGLNTHARALAAGDQLAGCTVHLVTEALDDGPILGQARVNVHPGDTSETLSARVLEQEHRLYPAVLERFLQGNREPLLLE